MPIVHTISLSESGFSHVIRLDVLLAVNEKDQKLPVNSLAEYAIITPHTPPNNKPAAMARTAIPLF